MMTDRTPPKQEISAEAQSSAMAKEWDEGAKEAKAKSLALIRSQPKEVAFRAFWRAWRKHAIPHGVDSRPYHGHARREFEKIWAWQPRDKKKVAQGAPDAPGDVHASDYWRCLLHSAMDLATGTGNEHLVWPVARSILVSALSAEAPFTLSPHDFLVLVCEIIPSDGFSAEGPVDAPIECDSLATIFKHWDSLDQPWLYDSILGLPEPVFHSLDHFFQVCLIVLGAHACNLDLGVPLDSLVLAAECLAQTTVHQHCAISGVTPVWNANVSFLIDGFSVGVRSRIGAMTAGNGVWNPEAGRIETPPVEFFMAPVLPVRERLLRLFHSGDSMHSDGDMLHCWRLGGFVLLHPPEPIPAVFIAQGDDGRSPGVFDAFSRTVRSIPEAVRNVSAAADMFTNKVSPQFEHATETLARTAANIDDAALRVSHLSTIYADMAAKARDFLGALTASLPSIDKMVHCAASLACLCLAQTWNEVAIICTLLFTGLGVTQLGNSLRGFFSWISTQPNSESKETAVAQGMEHMYETFSDTVWHFVTSFLPTGSSVPVHITAKRGQEISQTVNGLFSIGKLADAFSMAFTKSVEVIEAWLLGKTTKQIHDELCESIQEFRRRACTLMAGRELKHVHRLANEYRAVQDDFRKFCHELDEPLRTKYRLDLSRIEGDLVQVASFVATKEGCSGTRIRPVFIYVYGPSQAGKSTWVQEKLIPFILARYGKFTGADLQDARETEVHLPQVGANFDDTYTGQFIDWLDDTIFTVDPDRIVEWVESVVKAVNVAPYPIEAANVEAKGLKMYTSRFVIVSTNLANVRQNSVTKLLDPSVIDRRVNVKVNVYLDPLNGRVARVMDGRNILEDSRKEPMTLDAALVLMRPILDEAFQRYHQDFLRVGEVSKDVLDLAAGDIPPGLFGLPAEAQGASDFGLALRTRLERTVSAAWNFVPRISVSTAVVTLCAALGLVAAFVTARRVFQSDSEGPVSAGSNDSSRLVRPARRAISNLQRNAVVAKVGHDAGLAQLESFFSTLVGVIEFGHEGSLRRRVNCVHVTANIVLVVRHTVSRHIPHAGKAVIWFPRSSRPEHGFSYDPSCWSSDAAHDLTVLRVSGLAPVKASVLESHFKSDDGFKLGPIGSGLILTNRFSSQDAVSVVLPVTDMSLVTDEYLLADGTRVQLTDGIAGQAATRAGDCSGLWVSEDPSSTARILGLHVAGTPCGSFGKSALCKVVTREMIDSLVAPLRGPALAQGDLGVVARGKVPDNAKVRISSSSVIVPAVIQDICIEDGDIPRKAPAVLRAGSGALDKAMQKALCPIFEQPDPELCARVVDVAWSHLPAPPDSALLPLTDEEVIFGIDGFLNPMDLTRAVGYVEGRILGVQKKSQCVDLDRRCFRPEFKSMLDDLEAKLALDARGLLPDGRSFDALVRRLADPSAITAVELSQFLVPVYSAFLKDELLKIQYEGDPSLESFLECEPLIKQARLIQGCSMLWFVVFKRHFGRVMAWVAGLTGTDKSYLAAGVNPHSATQWRALAQRTRIDEHPDRIIAGDISNKDGTTGPMLSNMRGQVQARWLRAKAGTVAHHLLTRFNGRAALVCAGEVFALDGKIQTGKYLTFLDNSVDCDLLFTYAWFKQFRGNAKLDNDDAYRALVGCRLVACGDDTLATSGVADFNLRVVALHARDFGITFTDASKNADPEPFCPRESVDFCKRTFSRTDADAFHLSAPLAEASIQGMYQWCAGSNPRENTSMGVTAALREYFHYGRERFEAEKTRLRAMLHRKGLRVPDLTWAKCREQWLAGTYCGDETDVGLSWWAQGPPEEAVVNQDAENSTQTQTGLTFADDTVTVEADMPTVQGVVSDVLKDPLQLSDRVTGVGILEREYQIATYTQTTSQTAFTQLFSVNVLGALFANTKMADAVSHWGWFRCRAVRIKIRISGNAAFCGSQFSIFVPCKTSAASDLATFTSGAASYTEQYAEFGVATAPEVTMDLPWQIPVPSISVASLVGSANPFGMLVGFVNTPLVNVMASGSTTLTCLIFASIIGPELYGPINVALATPLGRAGAPVERDWLWLAEGPAEKSQEESEEKTGGAISGFLGTVSEVSGAVASVPSPLSPFASIASLVSGGLATLARWIGLENPPHVGQIQLVATHSTRGDTNVDAAVVSNSLGLTMVSRTANTAAYVGDSEDHMGFPQFLRHFCTVDQQRLQTSDTADAVIAHWWAGPMYVNGTTSTSGPNNFISWQPTRLSFASQYCEAWRGTMLFKFRFYGNALVRGRYRIVVLPAYQGLVVPTTYSSGEGDVLSFLLEISGEQEYIIAVPFMAGVVHKPVGMPTSVNGSGTMGDVSTYASAVLLMVAESPLVAPTTATAPIWYTVATAAGGDLCFYRPRSSILSVSNFQAQGLEEPTEAVEGRLVGPPLHLGIPLGEHFADAVVNFRDVINRMHLYSTGVPWAAALQGYYYLMTPFLGVASTIGTVTNGFRSVRGSTYFRVTNNTSTAQVYFVVSLPISIATASVLSSLSASNFPNVNGTHVHALQPGESFVFHVPMSMYGLWRWTNAANTGTAHSFQPSVETIVLYCMNNPGTIISQCAGDDFRLGMPIPPGYVTNTVVTSLPSY